MSKKMCVCFIFNTTEALSHDAVLTFLNNAEPTAVRLAVDAKRNYSVLLAPRSFYSHLSTHLRKMSIFLKLLSHFHQHCAFTLFVKDLMAMSTLAKTVRVGHYPVSSKLTQLGMYHGAFY